MDRFVTYKNGSVHFYKGEILKQHYDKDGYLKICLCRNGTSKYFGVHCLISMTFIQNDDPANKTQVNHKNEIKDDNKIDNLEWCTPQYNVTYGNAIKKRVLLQSLPVVQLTKDNKIIKIYNSGTIAERDFGYSQTNISLCCIGKRKYTSGYKWMYLKDYVPQLTEEEVEYYKSLKAPKPENTHKRKIVQLTLDYNFISQYDSILQAAKILGIKWPTAIEACCKGKAKKSNGFKWMYLEDYEKLKNNL